MVLKNKRGEKMKINLETLSYDELQNLSDEQIFEFLSYEWDKALNEDGRNFDYKELTQKQQEVLYILKPLHQLCITKESLGGGIQGYAKYSRLESKLVEEEDLVCKHDFSYLMKGLYFKGYIEPYKVVDFSEMPKEKFNEINIDELIKDDFTNEEFDYLLRWRYNFHWLYLNRESLFEKLAEEYGGEESYTYKESIYHSILCEGSITNLFSNCYFEITDIGLHWIHNITVQRMTSELEESLIEQKDRIKNFYKEIVTILGLLLAAFSFIGLNISTIPKIESGFVTKVLVINISIILVLQVIFLILKYFVFEAREFKGLKYWIISMAVTVIVLGITASLGHIEEKNGIEKFKEEIKKEQEKEEEKQAQLLDNMKSELEKQKHLIEELENMEELHRELLLKNM